jgi:N6-adenosine-specific RNA methylase IME4
MPQDALDVCKAWGFTPKSELVWIKTTKTSGPDLGTSKLAFGMGHQVRGAHETCIIATRGKCPPRSRSVRSVFFAPVGIHSAKPDVFFEIVEAMHEGPYVELFARRHRTGWDCYGNEIGTTLGVA